MNITLTNQMRNFAAVLALFFAAGALAQDVRLSHFHELDDLRFELASNVAAKPGETPSSQVLRFTALGRAIAIELYPNARFDGKYTDTSIQVLRGSVIDAPDSWARVVVADGLPRGLVWDGTDLIAIEAPTDSDFATTGPIAYRVADRIVDPSAMTCGMGHLTLQGNAYQNLVLELKSAAFQASQAAAASVQLDLGAVGDFEFFETHGSSSEAAILTRLNNVDGIFSEQVGVQITVTEIDVFTDVNDPFSDTLDAGDLLDELRMYRASDPQQRATGLTHMYTGKNLDTTTVGIAFLGAVCSTNFGAGLSEGRRGPTTDALIAAHEIGHNFGAPHDGDPGACENTPEDFLMAPSVNGSDQFSQCSIDQMQPEIASASCLTPLATVDVAVDGTPESVNIEVGDTDQFMFQVSSLGTDAANNTVLDLATAGSVTIVSATSSAGSCTLGSGGANCAIGTVTGGANVNVTATIRGDAAGNATVTGTTSADGDTNANNDSDSVAVTVVSAVDMALAAAAPVSVNEGETQNGSFRIDNLSNQPASGVNVTVTFDTGARPTGASFAPGSCSISGQTATCTAASLAAQTQTSLSFTVEGETEGSYNYQANVTANEMDPATANNSITGAITVNAPAPPPPPPPSGGGSSSGGGGGGGGMPGLPLFALLGLGLFARLRR